MLKKFLSSLAKQNGARDQHDTGILIKNDTWGYVAGEIVKPTVPTAAEGVAAITEADVAQWLNAGRKAKADLILAIRPSELGQIRGCETSREVWLKLESVYGSKGPVRKTALLKRLTQQKMEDGDDLTEHLCGFFDAVDKLSSMEIDINEELLTIMLL